MSIQCALIRLARAAVRQIIAQMNQQVTLLQEQGLAPMQAMVNTISGGEWRGEGANAFVEEVTGVIASMNGIINAIDENRNNIVTSVDIIERADQQVRSLIQSRLADTFRFY